MVGCPRQRELMVQDPKTRKSKNSTFKELPEGPVWLKDREQEGEGDRGDRKGSGSRSVTGCGILQISSLSRLPGLTVTFDLAFEVLKQTQASD